MILGCESYINSWYGEDVLTKTCCHAGFVQYVLVQMGKNQWTEGIYQWIHLFQASSLIMKYVRTCEQQSMLSDFNISKCKFVISEIW